VVRTISESSPSSKNVEFKSQSPEIRVVFETIFNFFLKYLAKKNKLKTSIPATLPRVALQIAVPVCVASLTEVERFATTSGFLRRRQTVEPVEKALLRVANLIAFPVVEEVGTVAGLGAFFEGVWNLNFSFISKKASESSAKKQTCVEQSPSSKLHANKLHWESHLPLRARLEQPNCSHFSRSKRSVTLYTSTGIWTSQKRPVKPRRQSHRKAFTSSTQTPPFPQVLNKQMSKTPKKWVF
jgi:hypothetical protein